MQVLREVCELFIVARRFERIQHSGIMEEFNVAALGADLEI